MIELLKPFWSATVKYCLIVGAALLVLFKARQSGKESVRNENIKESLKGVKVRDKVENNVISAPDSERDRLRKKWQRD